MFMGHFAPAVWDTKRGSSAPLIPLWLGFLAVQFIDIVFALLAIAGIEGTGTMVDGVPIFDIPFSHSLIGSLFLSFVGAVIFQMISKAKGPKVFFVFAMLIFSHWILDIVVHRPDLPLYPGSSVMMGFGIWNFPYLAYALEMGMLLVGFLFWMKVTTPKSALYSVLPWVMFAVMGVMQYIFITLPGLEINAGTFDMNSGPQGATAGILMLLTFSIIAAWVAWIERGRPSKFSA